MEVSTEPALVGVARDAHHHRVAVLPVREERQARGLAAELVFRIVQVGKVLDLGQGHEPGQPGAECHAEDRLLVEQGVEDPSGTEPFLQPARHAVHPALDRHVLPEHERLRVDRQDVDECPVDRLGEGERARVLGQVPVEGLGTHRRRRRTAGFGADAIGPPRRQRRHDLVGGRQLRAVEQRERDRPHLGASLEVPVDEVGRRRAELDERGGGAENRIALLVGPHGRGGPIGRFDVGAGVPEEPDGPEMQQPGRSRRADLLDEVGRDPERRDRVGAVGIGVGELWAVTERRLDPTARRRHADAETVVLADEEQRHRKACVCAVAGRVDGTLRSGVVGARIAERAHDDRVRGPRAVDTEPPRTTDRERHAEGTREVGCDGRGLGDDRQLVMAEHLVSATGDRLVAESEHAGEHVGHGAVAGALTRTGAVEAARSVVQERRVGEPQRGGDRSIALVARRTDRVEAVPTCSQPPRRVVEDAAVDLGGEDVVERNVGTIVDRVAARRDERGDRVEQGRFELVQIVGAHASERRSARRQPTTESKSMKPLRWAATSSGVAAHESTSTSIEGMPALRLVQLSAPPCWVTSGRTGRPDPRDQACSYASGVDPIELT